MKTAQISNVYDYARKIADGTKFIVCYDDDGCQVYVPKGMTYDCLSIINQPLGGGIGVLYDAMETYHMPSRRIKRFRSEESVKRSIRRFVNGK